ncbi:MAG: dihydrofolate reductase family protein [Armatimonadetes bacterium]|nr:dihydrofolate reductase family protein [Armatimonadota bacterium]MDW8153562.1 dihydrofolate reductase family protein [Armatimonadota bacterium]
MENLYADLRFPDRPDRPHVALHLVMSADGGATLQGRTGGMGGTADRLAFRRLREACDAILVGAGTVREEAYGPPRLPLEAQARRTARGLAPLPRLVIVTARAALDPTHRVFSDPDRRPLVVIPEDAEAEVLNGIAQVAEVMRCGRREVDLGRMLQLLHARGIRWAVCEGGPVLAGRLLALDLVDELFLTVAPWMVGSGERRLVEGVLDPPRRLRLVEAREHEGDLLLRYALLGKEEPPGR